MLDLSAGETAGYVASLLVFATFYMRTMVALRCLAIASNIAFIIYAQMEGLLPVLLLHCALLPTNIYRLVEIWRLISSAREVVNSGFPLAPLVPFMTEIKVRAGDRLFALGDLSDGLYYVASGRINIPERDAVVGEGEVIGEISLFTADKRRTASAVCVEDGVVLFLSESTVLQVFYKNPQFGFALIRSITSRLHDNCQQLEQELKRRDGTSTAGGAAADGVPPMTPVPVRAAQEGSRTRARRLEEVRSEIRRQHRNRRVTVAVTILVPLMLIGAVSYTQHDYVSSLIFRDAVVTSWRNAMSAPISGDVRGPMPDAGSHVADGPATIGIVNPRANDTELSTVTAEIALVRKRIVELTEHADELRALLERRRQRSRDYAAFFRETLDLEIAGLREELGFVDQQLSLYEALSNRQQTLARSGNAALSAADQALAETMALRSQRSELEKDLARTLSQRSAANESVYLQEDGSNPDWADHSNDIFELRLAEAEDDIAEEEATLDTLLRRQTALQDHLDRTSRATVALPAGSTIQSVAVVDGTTVEPGDLLFEWIDCGDLLVDVPVSDLGVELFAEGMGAEVVLGGYATPLEGRILEVRGAGNRLGRDDLAAVAGDPGSAHAQVLVALQAPLGQGDECPVGQSAFVTFNDVTMLDRLAAYFRL